MEQSLNSTGSNHIFDGEVAEKELIKLEIKLEKENMEIAKILGITQFEVKVPGFRWSFSRISAFLTFCEKQLKCDEEDCQEKVCFLDFQTKESLCLNHFYCLKKTDVLLSENTFCDVLKQLKGRASKYEESLIQIKPVIKVFQQNKDNLKYLSEKITQLLTFEKELDFFVLSISELMKTSKVDGVSKKLLCQVIENLNYMQKPIDSKLIIEYIINLQRKRGCSRNAKKLR